MREIIYSFNLLNPFTDYNKCFGGGSSSVVLNLDPDSVLY